MCRFVFGTAAQRMILRMHREEIDLRSGDLKKSKFTSAEIEHFLRNENHNVEC